MYVRTFVRFVRDREREDIWTVRSLFERCRCVEVTSEVRYAVVVVNIMVWRVSTWSTYCMLSHMAVCVCVTMFTDCAHGVRHLYDNRAEQVVAC